MNVPEFSPDNFEPKWQRYWEEQELFEVDTSDPEVSDDKYYCLVMFPYPSGSMHVGHGRNYIIADALVRYKMMKRKNVLSPMGWDAFGLPAENAAIEKDIHPSEWTNQNINGIRDQLKRWGIGYDWSREIASCHPGYYRWTQWLFLQLYREGLAYRKGDLVNWCEQCQTVLANEQVIDDHCERCNCRIREKELEQWFFRITDYADELLEDLEDLDDWPDEVKEMQRNWIGRSEGAEITFRIQELDETVTCFTTRPDTLFGVTFMVLAPEHPAVTKLAELSNREAEIMDLVDELRSEDRNNQRGGNGTKRGKFLDAHAINPINGEEVPVYVADYAMMEYGTGAVMAVPAHDQRDFEFAQKHGIKIRPVVEPEDEQLDASEMEEAYEGPGEQINSESFNGMPNDEAGEKITDQLEEEGTGSASVQYRLQDWLISRQRYWGAPIPVIYCDDCGTVPVPEENLPVELPDVSDFKPTGDSPLAEKRAFRNTTCPECGQGAERETDTMDTFVDSSWYFLRYISPRLEDAPWDREDVNRWMPVDQYIGGVEHAVLHLLYARFITKFLRDIDWVQVDEPFSSLFTQGMIYRRSYRCPECRQFLPEDEVEQTGEKTWKHRECGSEVDSKMTKMSKSKNNVISPDQLIDEYGADVERLYTLFMAPPQKDAEWDDEAISGCDRFLRKVWRIVHRKTDLIKGSKGENVDPEKLEGDVKDLYRETHRTIKEVTGDVEDRLHPNTAIASLMEFVNQLQNTELDDGSENSVACFRFALETLVKLLSPFAPHTAEELWQTMGRSPSILEKDWPHYKEEHTKAEEIEIAIQVDGELRDTIHVDVNIEEDDLRERVRSNERVQEYLNGSDPERIIVVPEKLVNVVTKSE